MYTSGPLSIANQAFTYSDENLSKSFGINFKSGGLKTYYGYGKYNLGAFYWIKKVTKR